MKTYRAGIDIGSTTVKLVVLDQDGTIAYGDYRRHHAHTQGTLKSLLVEAKQKLGPCELQVKITGSGAINLAKALNLDGREYRVVQADEAAGVLSIEIEAIRT